MKEKHEGISVTPSWLETTSPYNSNSPLSRSLFIGYYPLFLLCCILFIIVYPTLKYINEGSAFHYIDYAFSKLTRSSFVWDSIFIFCLWVFMLVVMRYRLIRGNRFGMLTVFLVCVGSGQIIISKVGLYFTDKIFIVVLSWAGAFKIISYDLEVSFRQKLIQTPQIKLFSSYHPPESELSHEPQDLHVHISQETRPQPSVNHPQPTDHLHTSTKEKTLKKISVDEKDMEQLLLFIVSPLPCYWSFLRSYNPGLRINKLYLTKKVLHALLFLLLNNIVLAQFIEPVEKLAPGMSSMQVLFKLIPPIFCLHMILYFMVFQVIINSLAEVSRLTYRRFYEDWWNANDLHEFLHKWCMLYSMWMHRHFHRRESVKLGVVVGVMLVMLVQVFGKGVRLFTLLGGIALILIVGALGKTFPLNNNYIIHLAVILWSPTVITLQFKFGIFD